MRTHPFSTVERPSSLVDTLLACREQAPDRTALTVLRDGESVEASLTFRGLLDVAVQAGAGLAMRCPRGARVLLLLPTGAPFVGAFLGCLVSGRVPVPVNAPQQTRKLGPWKKLQAIADNSGGALLVTSRKGVQAIAALQVGHALFARCEVVAWEDLLAEGDGATQGDVIRPRGTDLAFLQYTSGSTGSPKGVMLTHGNLVANQEVIASLMGRHRHTRTLSWLPLYHDMGLSAVLQMVALGCETVLMSPVAFAESPMRWLRAITDHRVHTTGGPNFAYRLATQALQAVDVSVRPLDLSSWTVAFCGAEPIDRATVEAFVAAAAPHGFSSGALHACYGMAETTLQVTGAPLGGGLGWIAAHASRLADGVLERVPETDTAAKCLVSCGAPGPGVDVRIVGANGRPVSSARHVGEIWVRGPSVGQGYHGQVGATRDTFGATLPEDGGGPYLRTGDLGLFVDGALYVTGRLKDLLIVRGRNLYPQDVEACVQDAVPEVRRDCGAVFSVPVEGEEQLVVVQEVGRTQRRSLDTADTLRRIVAAIGDDFGVTPHQVVLVEPATVEKTSSGKIARTACREVYLQGTLRAVATWTAGETTEAPSTAVAGDTSSSRRQALENIVAGVASTFLKRDASRVSRTTPWNELGFDSVNALQLALKVQQVTGLPLDATVLWECANIEELAVHLQGLDAAPAARPLPTVAPRTGAATPAPTATSLAAVSDAEAEAMLLKALAH